MPRRDGQPRRRQGSPRRYPDAQSCARSQALTQHQSWQPRTRPARRRTNLNLSRQPHTPYASPRPRRPRCEMREGQKHKPKRLWQRCGRAHGTDAAHRGQRTRARPPGSHRSGSPINMAQTSASTLTTVPSTSIRLLHVKDLLEAFDAEGNRVTGQGVSNSAGEDGSIDVNCYVVTRSISRPRHQGGHRRA